MRRTHFAAAGVVLLLTACAPDSNSPTLVLDEPRLTTGWMGGGGRAAGSDSTGAQVTSANGTGWMGGGGRADDSAGVAPK